MFIKIGTMGKKSLKKILFLQCSSVEQKLKQVSEEMNCQRHNAESCRRALEQKLKDQERNSQKVQLPATCTVLDKNAHFKIFNQNVLCLLLYFV